MSNVAAELNIYPIYNKNVLFLKAKMFDMDNFI